MAKAKPKEVDVTEIKECPDCGSMNININEEKQQVICLDCGLIYEPLSPDIETRFETTHEPVKTRLEVGELLPPPAPEKPKRERKPKKAKKAAKKKSAKKKAAKKKPAKKPAKKAVKKKPAKKKAVKKAAKKKPAKKGLASRLLKKITRVKKKKKGSFNF